MSDLLTLREGAKKLKLCESNLRKIIRAGQLPTIRLGRRVLLTEQDLQEFVDKNRRG